MFYGNFILLYLYHTTSWNFSCLSHMACWRPQIWRSESCILESILARVTRELTGPPIEYNPDLWQEQKVLSWRKLKICHKQRVLSWEKKFLDNNFRLELYYIIMRWRKEISKKKNNKKVIVMSNWGTRFSNICVTVLS